MKTSEKSLDQHVQFWSLLGPAALLLTLFVILVKTPFEGFALPFIAIAGFIASWLGRMKGVCGALVALAGLAFHHLYGLGTLHVLWYTGISSALALAWVATALGREEIDALLYLGSRRKDTQAKELELLARRYAADQQKAVAQLQEERLRIEELQRELEQSQVEIAALQKQGEQVPRAMRQLQSEHAQALAAVNRDLDAALKENEALSQYREQALAVKTAYDKIVQELQQLHGEKEAFQSKALNFQTMLDSLQVRLNEKEAQVNQLSLHAGALDALHKSLQEKEAEIGQWSSTAEHLKVELNELKKEREALNECVNEKEGKIKELAQIASVVEHLKIELEKAKAQKEPSKEPVIRSEAKAREDRALCHVEGLYQQLRVQFEEKSNLLNEARKELFHAQEKLLLQQKIKEEESVYGSTATEKKLEAHLGSLLTDLTRLEEENILLEEIIGKLI